MDEEFSRNRKQFALIRFIVFAIYSIEGEWAKLFVFWSIMIDWV